jgi:hypothetical protein
MFFIVLLSLFNQFLPGTPVEREMMCCKMRENKLEEVIAPCCIENQKRTAKTMDVGANAVIPCVIVLLPTYKKPYPQE